MMESMESWNRATRAIRARRAARVVELRPSARWAIAFALAIFLPGSVSARNQTPADLQRRLEAIEQQAARARNELDALSRQIAELKKAAGGEAATTPAATATATTPEVEAAAGESAERSAAPSARSGQWFLRTLLILVIVSAIFFIARIFFMRWRETDSGEAPRAVAPALAGGPAPADPSGDDEPENRS
jgi:hypothetical protein